MTGAATTAPSRRGQAAFAAALLDPAQPVPEGWFGHNGADPTPRLAVYRNNVVVSLMAALADTFPVTRRRLGAEAFDGLARWHVVDHPPRSAVLTDWGDDFADGLAAHACAHAQPWLPDLARLERARVRACHAADAAPMSPEAIAARLADPDRLPAARLRLHPSLQVLRSAHAVVSIWAAAQDAGPAPNDGAPQTPESAVVLRDAHDDVLVLPVQAHEADLLQRIARGDALGAAVTAAAAEAPHDDPPALVAVLTLLIRHGALCAWLDDGDLRCVPCCNA